MGLQQSTQKYHGDGIPQLSESMAIYRTENNDTTEREDSRKINIICRKSRRSRGLLDIRYRKGTLYIYFQINGKNPKLIKTISLMEINIDREHILNNYCVSSDRYICVPEMDIDSKTPILTIYSLEDIFTKNRLRFVRSIALDSSVTVNQLVGDVLHQVYLHHNHVGVRIISHELTGDRATRSLDVNSTVEKLRFSLSGSIIGIYGRDVLNVYRPRRTIDPDYTLSHTVKLVYSDRYSLLDLIITDGQTAYYVMKDRDTTYHCVSILSDVPQNRIIGKTQNMRDDFLSLHQIDVTEYGSLFVPDLDFYSSDGELVTLRNLVAVIDMHRDRIRIRILAEMVNNGVMSSISLIGTHDINVVDLDHSNSTVSYDGFLTVRTDRIRVYDINKIVGSIVSVGLANLIRGQIVQQIINEYPKAMNLIKRMEIDRIPSRIIVRAADDRDTEYAITSKIANYSVCISSIYESIDKSRKNADLPIYQLTVNSNMTLMDIKSYEIFERLLDGDILPVDVVDKIFSHYPKSSYDRFQTTIEILDHIYDYTKFILLDIDLKSNQVLDQIFGLYKKRVALLVAYICCAIVMDYYDREIDLPYCTIGETRIKRTVDFDITDEIAINFHHNFQPFKTAIDNHLALLNIT